MKQLSSIAALAQRAAGLLPEPPPAHDAFGYLAWEELVLSTAARLRVAAGSRISEMLRLCDAWRPTGTVITWQDLIWIANGTWAEGQSWNAQVFSTPDPSRMDKRQCLHPRPKSGVGARARFAMSVPPIDGSASHVSTDAS